MNWRNRGGKVKKKKQWGTKNFLVDSYIFGSWVFQKTHKAVKSSYKGRKVLDPSYVNEP